MRGKHLVLIIAILALPAAAVAQGMCPAFQQSESTFPPEGGPGSFAVVAATVVPQCWWAPTGITFDSAADPWIHISHYDWTLGSGNVDYTVAPNPDPGERTGVISVADQPLHTVHQDGNCRVTVNQPPAAGELYVTNTACEQVIEVGDQALRIYPSSFPGTPTIHGEGIEYGPDNMLYVAEPGNGIFQIDPGTAQVTWSHNSGGGGTAPFAPRAMRFAHNGDLIVIEGSAGGGLYLFENTAATGAPLDFASPHLIAGSAGVGTFTDLTTAANGDLLVAGSDGGGGKVWRVPFDSAGGGYGAPSEVASGLATPAGIARTSTGVIVVGDGSDLDRIVSGSPEVCTSGFGGGTIATVEPSADDTLYVTVNSSDESEGRLYGVPFTRATAECGAPDLVATFDITNNPTGTTPLFGVAVPFTSTDGKEVINLPAGVPEASQLFNFFDSVYEFRAVDNSECKVNVSAEEFSPEQVKALIDTLPAGVSGARPITFWGDNGRAIGYHYTAQVGSSCPSDGTTLYEHAIDAYYSGFNPQIMRCENPADTGNSGCELFTFKSYYPGFGFFPDDSQVGGFLPRFSTTFLVDLASDDTHYAGSFCGFQSPLTDLTDPKDPALPVFNPGSSMPVKFAVADTDHGGNCQNGPYITKTIVAVMSLARVFDGNGDPDFKPIPDVDITGGGSFSDNRIVFANPSSKNKPFALQIKLSENDTNLPPGTYQVVVTDDTAATSGGSTFYFPAQHTYFVVK